MFIGMAPNKHATAQFMFIGMAPNSKLLNNQVIGKTIPTCVIIA